MVDRNRNFRSVNRILGERPRLGPFPADQILPWAVIAIMSVFIIYYMLKGGWLATFLSMAWGWATWWIVSSKNDFFGKFVGVPRISRGYKPFVPLLKIENSSVKKSPKKSKIHRVKMNRLPE